MPRTSYGSDKQAQVWKLVAALIQARGDSLVTEITRDGVAITYRNWPGVGTPQLEVQATLKDLGPFCSLSIDQVRESLTAHLADYLQILEDRREQKAGRNAGTWIFVLTLWSTDLEENRQQFEALWLAKKTGLNRYPNPSHRLIYSSR